MNELTKTVVNVAEPTVWAAHGLPGLVILALFVLLAFTIWYGLNRLDKIASMNIDAWKDLHEQHRDERDTWKSESSERIREFKSALERLTDRIANK